MSANDSIHVSPGDRFIRREDHAIVVIDDMTVSRTGSAFAVDRYRADGYEGEWINDIHDRIESQALIPLDQIDEYIDSRGL